MVNADLTSLTNLTAMQKLSLFDNPLITDLTPLTNMTSMTELYLSLNNISDISAVAGTTSLTLLDVNNNSALSNFNPLFGTLGVFTDGLQSLISLDVSFTSYNCTTDSSVSIEIPNAYPVIWTDGGC